ncbi:DUF2971 domain-containing protein [Paenochrobactrum pullorum]|uniref:DUF2971 domain-containing protein n=1 Tax=Paenochrobactrum pullorum TaxID=1324351 RepID=UPI0035BC0444
MRIIILDDLDEKKAIYRIVRLDHLERMFHYKKNVLVRPSSWDDKFEGQLIKAGLSFQKDGSKLDCKDRIYAQCWTLEYSSALMWAAYAKNKFDYVRIQTTVGKLKESLQSALDQTYGDFAAYIGKVNYLNYRDMQKQLNELANSPPSWKTLSQLTLMKSVAFSGENEVRLIQLMFNEDKREPLSSYNCDMHQLIDCIRLPPGLTKEESKERERFIKKLTGFDKIHRSELYDGKKLKLISFSQNFDPSIF